MKIHVGIRAAAAALATRRRAPSKLATVANSDPGPAPHRSPVAGWGAGGTGSRTGDDPDGPAAGATGGAAGGGGVH